MTIVLFLFEGKFCRSCYCIWTLILLVLITATLGTAFFWYIEIFKLRPQTSETVDLTTSAVYNVTSDFPLSNIFSSHLCLSFKKSSSKKYHVDSVAYVTLASETCNLVTTYTKNETVYQDSALEYEKYMFYWLNGTSFSFHAYVNGSSLVSVYLLNDRNAASLCSNHLKPENIVNEWSFNLSNCDLTYSGLMGCSFSHIIDTSDTYYICVNSTIYAGLSYNISISSTTYNTSASSTALRCTWDKDCCLPFGDLITELDSPTCMFVTTSPLNPAYIGMELVDVHVRVDQRLWVIWNCFFLLAVLFLLLFVTLLFCQLTRYKVKHPDFDPRGCVVQCSVY